jgi:hypothetical protein
MLRSASGHAAPQPAGTLDAGATSGDPRTDLRAIAGAFRSLALARPEAYALCSRASPKMHELIRS